MKSTRDDPDVGRFPQPFVFSTADEKTKVSVRDDFYYDKDPLYAALKDKFDALQSQITDLQNNAIQSGSNPNGSWVKLPDGTLFQYGIFMSSSGGWKTANPTISLPLSFVDSNYRITFQPDTDTTPWSFAVSLLKSKAAGSFVIRPAVGVTDSGTSVEIEWIAIGRWKA